MARVTSSCVVLLLLLSVCSWGVSRASASVARGDLNVDPETWMYDIKDYIYNYTLLELTLPGTHDSGFYEYQDIVGPEESPKLSAMIKLAEAFHLPLYPFIANWSLAQETTFYEQLMGGIRYLDLRACIYNYTWHTEHFLLGVPTQVLLDDIKKFMSNHTGEVIILQVGDLSGSTYYDRVVLVEMLNNTLGEYIAHLQPEGFDNFTVGEMVATNQRIVVVWPDARQFEPPYDILWDLDTFLEGEYANMNTVKDMQAWNVGEINKYMGKGKLFELSWTLTTQVSDIEKTLVDEHLHPRTLKEFALIADAALPDFFNKYRNYKLGNMLLVDFWDYSTVVSIAINNNVRMCNDDLPYIQPNADNQYCRHYYANGNCTNTRYVEWMSTHCALSCGFC